MPPFMKLHTELVARRHFLQTLGLGFLSGFGMLDVTHAESNFRSRIVCVGGGITEIVCALGFESSLVGVDTTSRYPLSVHRLPSVGYARHLSLEGVLALAPRQVIVGQDAGPQAVLARLREAGIPVTTVDEGQSIEGLISRVKQIGQLLDCEDQSSAFAEMLELEWSALEHVVPAPREKIRVMFVLGQTPGQFMVAGTRTGADTMLRYAGLENAFADLRGYRSITPEGIITAQPDLIVFTQPDANASKVTYIGGKFINQIKGLSETPAARPERWLVFDTMYLLGFGPRMPDAVLTLRRASMEAMRA